MKNTNTTARNVLRALLARIEAVVEATPFHTAYVAECERAGELDARGEVAGALSLATEREDVEAAALFGGVLALVDARGGKFPVGVWAVCAARLAFAYVNGYYVALAAAERARGIDWPQYLRDKMVAP